MDLNITSISLFIQNNHIGDYASIIGLFITFIGFFITILNLVKTRKASEVATAAVNNIRSDLKKVDTVAILSSILAEMEEIKQLHRAKNNILLPEKYSKLRASLISIKNYNSILIESDLKILQSAITQLNASEKALDKAIDMNNDNSPISISKFNGLISNHIDKLNEVLIRIKSNIGDNP